MSSRKPWWTEGYGRLHINMDMSSFLLAPGLKLSQIPGVSLRSTAVLIWQRRTDRTPRGSDHRPWLNLLSRSSKILSLSIRLPHSYETFTFRIPWRSSPSRRSALEVARDHPKLHLTLSTVSRWIFYQPVLKKRREFLLIPMIVVRFWFKIFLVLRSLDPPPLSPMYMGRGSAVES